MQKNKNDQVGCFFVKAKAAGASWAMMMTRSSFEEIFDEVLTMEIRFGNLEEVIIKKMS